MKQRSYILAMLLVAALGSTPAVAAPEANKNIPPNTVDSGVVSLDMLTKIQNYQVVIKGPNDTQEDAVIVRTILPPDWTAVEQGRKKDSKEELDPAVGMYTLIAKPPTADNATDFVYELRVYTRGLLDGLDTLKDDKGKPITIPAKDRNEKGMFSLYLNSMISDFVKLKYKTVTKQNEMQPVPYGIIPDEKTGKPMLMGTRPEPMFFIPIRFQSTVDGSTIYTFNGVIGQKVVSLRFLVAKDQAEYYQSTIALILNNTWGLTLAQEVEWDKEMQAKIKAADKGATKPN